MFEQSAKQIIAQLVQQDFQLLPNQAGGAYVLAKPYHPVLYLVQLIDGTAWTKEQVSHGISWYAKEMKGWMEPFRCSQGVLLTVLCLPKVTEEEQKNWISSDWMPSGLEETQHLVFWLCEENSGRYWAPKDHPTRLLHIQDAIQQGLRSHALGSESETVWETAKAVDRQTTIAPRLSTASATLALILLLVVLYGVFRFVPQQVQQQYWNNGTAVWQQGEVWRLGTALFFHADFLHLGYNCLSLYIFGSLLERYEGRGFFFVTFFLSGLVGNVVSSLLCPPQVYALGASGAIFGLIGAFLVRSRQEKRQLEGWNYPTVALFVVISLVLGGVSPDVDNWAHLGGCLCGMGLEWLWGKGRKKMENEA